MIQTISINGKDHSVDQLPVAARAQVANIQVADAELARLNQRQVLVQTARNAYVSALLAALEAPVAEPVGTGRPAVAKKTVARKTARKPS